MKSLLVCAFCFMLLTSCDDSNIVTSVDNNTVRTVDQLNKNEKEALDSLTERIYKDAGAQFFYTTTYYYKPSPEDDGLTKEKLDKPLVLLSGACVGSHMLEESTLALIKTEMETKQIIWSDSAGNEHCLSIREGYLIQKPGGAGGTAYMSNDMVTLVPTKIEVK